MIEEKSKFTVLALSLSVLTLAGISALLSVNKSSVLGENTVKPYRPAPTSVQTFRSLPCTTVQPLLNSCNQTPGDIPICTKLRSLYQFYCGNLAATTPSLSPTRTPSPSPTTTCKTGINSYKVTDTCCQQYDPTCSVFSKMIVTCYDGYVTTRTGNCWVAETWKATASEICKGRSSCTTTPSPSPKPTAYPIELTTPKETTINCTVNDPNCFFYAPVIGFNRTGVQMFTPTLFTTDRNGLTLIMGEDGQWTTKAEFNRTVQPNDETFNTLVKAIPPTGKTGTFFNRVHGTGRSCPTCQAYGGSTMDIIFIVSPESTDITPTTAPPTKPTTTPTTSAIRCGWSCGSCLNLNKVDPGIMCPDIMPPKDTFCYNIGGVCKKISLNN